MKINCSVSIKKIFLIKKQKKFKEAVLREYVSSYHIRWYGL